MWKLIKDEMDSATLIDCVWPLGTDGPGTAGMGHDPPTAGGEWDEPLVGADIVDIWSFDDFPICPNDEKSDEATSCEYISIGDLSVCSSKELEDGAAPPGHMAVDDLVPMYNIVKELKDEVANNLLVSILDGGDVIDSLEDIDLDEFFREINPSRAYPPRVLPSPRRPTRSIVGDTSKESRPCLSSPAPSCDSGVSSASSSLKASDLGRFPVPIAVKEGPGSETTIYKSYETIDSRALGLSHCDFGGGADWAMATTPEVKGEAAAFERDDTSPTEFDSSSVSTDASEEEGEERKTTPSSPCRIDHSYHAFAEQPADSGEKKTVARKGRGRKSAKSKAPVELRKTKKKEQNKNAAQRYRMKKKMETGSVFMEEQEAEKRNKELKSEVEGLEREIKYLKDLMAEVNQRRK